MKTKTAKTVKAVKTFNKKAVRKVVDFEKSAVRVQARATLADAPISVEKGADMLAVRILEEKRKYYALKGCALGKAERVLCIKKNAKAIAAQHKALYALVAQGGWSSLDEVKMYTRAKGIFDARIIDGRIVVRTK